MRRRVRVLCASTALSVCLGLGAVGSAVPAGAAAPAPPTGLAVSAPARGLVTASWTAASPAPLDGYHVEVTAGARHASTTTTGTSVRMPVPFNGPYSVTVTSREAGTTSAPVSAGTPSVVDELLLTREGAPVRAVPITAGSTFTQKGTAADLVVTGSVATHLDRYTLASVSDGALWVGGVGGESRRRLDGTDGASGEPAVTPGGTVAFLKDVAGGRELWVIATDGTGLRRVLDAGPYELVRATERTDRVLVKRSGGSAGLLYVGLAGGTLQPVPDTATVTDVDVSRTGSLLLVTTDGDVAVRAPGINVMWMRDANDPASFAAPAWDPWGTRFALTRSWPLHPERGTQVVVAASGGVVSTVMTLTDQRTGIVWSRDDVSAPAVSVTGPSLTTGTSALAAFTVSDADDPVSSLTVTCAVDGDALTPCTSGQRTRDVTPGAHDFMVRVEAPTGRSGFGSTRWYRDATAPTTDPLAVPVTTAAASVSVPVVAHDDSQVAGHDGAVRVATLGSGLGGWQFPSSWQGQRAQDRLTTGVTQGNEYCLTARSVDLASRLGAWAATRCVSVILDDRGLTAGSGWTRRTSSLYEHGTYTSAVRAGSVLTRAGVSARRVAVVATRCASCGAVDVWLGGVYQGRVNLRTSGTAYRAVTWLPLQSTTRSGTLTLRTVNASWVAVDGIAVQH